MLYGPALLLALLIVAGGWYGYGEFQRRQQAAVEATKAKPLPDPIGRSYLGKLRAQKTILIPAPMDGTLESVEVSDGDEVFEGQLLGKIRNSSIELGKQSSVEELERAKTRLGDLESQWMAARLEASRASADLARVRSEHETASRNFTLQQKLFREGATARKTYEKSEADFRKLTEDLKEIEEAAKSSDARVRTLQSVTDEARARVKEKTEALEESDADLLTGEVKAPVTGLLIGHNKAAGEQVTRDIEDLFEIAIDLGAMAIVVDIPEALAKKLAAGGRAFVQISEAGEAPLNGTIKVIKDLQVVVEFLSPNPVIRPGMSGQVRFLD